MRKIVLTVLASFLLFSCTNKYDNMYNLYIEQLKEMEYDQAFTTLNKMIEQYPDDYQLLSQKLQILFNTGDFENAEECAKMVISLKPDHAEAIMGLGFIYYKLGRKDEFHAHIFESITKYKTRLSTLKDKKLIENSLVNIIMAYYLLDMDDEAEIMIHKNSDILGNGNYEEVFKQFAERDIGELIDEMTSNNL